VEVAVRRGVAAAAKQWTDEAAAAWNGFWFAPADPAPLAMVRIGLAMVMAWSSLTAWPHIGDWLSLSGSETAGMIPASAWSLHRGAAAWVWHLLHGLQLSAIVAMGLGWKTRFACPIALALHVSFINAAHDAAYGYDVIVSLLLLYLSVSPCGGAWSIEAGRKGERRATVGANLGLRLIQVHACAIYLAAGLAKLEGASWWSGMAAYQSMLVPERWLAPFSFEFAFDYPWTATALSNVLTYLTLGFEIGFPFLVWSPLLRGPLLALGVLLHLGTVVFMGMEAFGLAMMLMLAAFVPASRLKSLGR
jgi:hypothetical protein